MSWLAENCPRLALAGDEYLRAVEAERERQRVLRDAELRWQQIVAHRELQLLWAGATGDRRYVSRRMTKLQRAQARLAEIEKQRQTAPADGRSVSRSGRKRRIAKHSKNGRRREVAS